MRANLNPLNARHSSDAVRFETVEAAQRVHQFLRRTRELTASEQAELLGAAVEAASATASRAPRPSGASTSSSRPASTNASTRRSGRDVDWGALARGVQQGLGYFQTGAQIAGDLASAFGGNDAGARDFALWANRLGQGAGQVGNFMQGFGGNQASAPRAAASAAPFAAPLPAPVAAQYPDPAMFSPQAGQPPMAPGPATDAPAANATAMLALLLNNPLVMQALRLAPFSSSAPSVAANVPGAAPASVPLSTVMATIAQLAQASSRELSEMATEDEQQVPDYLLADDGSLLADPASPQERAAVALQRLRIGAEARRYDLAGAGRFDRTRLDAADVWARDAGLDD